ncbi:MAG: hypothetical protein SPF22_04475 [Candidatus Onthovivens sp.]|nr:hypothetical protein [Candidatus Onthovivens sp.]
MKTIEGSVEKVFAVINTTKYNDDGKYAVTIAKMSELPDLGFEANEINKLDNVEVDTLMTTDYVGAFVMRLA